MKGCAIVEIKEIQRVEVATTPLAFAAVARMTVRTAWRVRS
jgi:hypothetical protein